MDYFDLKKNILIICLLFVLPCPCFASTLTLEQCINRGLTHNPEVEAYRLAIDEASEGINEAWGAFLPTLSISYNYNQLSNGSSGEQDSDYLDQNSNSFSCRLTQPIFNGFSGVAGLKRARQSKQYRQSELHYMQRQLIREISVSFFNLLHARQRVIKWQDSVQRLEQQSEIARSWVEQRLAPRLRLLDIGVELSNARHELIRSQSDEAIAIAQLRAWLVLDRDDVMRVSEDLYDDIIGSPCASLDICIEQSLERPVLKLAKLNVEMARQDAKVILSRNLPQAQIDASWTDYQRDYDESRYHDDDRDYYSVAFNVSMKLFQGGRNLSAWRKQRIAINRHKQMLSHQRLTIVSDVQTRYQQLVESRARIKTAQDRLVKAKAAYELTEKSAELGVVSLGDLLDSEIRLTNAEITHIDSQHSLQLALVNLQYATMSE